MNSYSLHNRKVKLTPTLREILIGHLLGDASLSYKRTGSGSLYFRFSQVKKEATRTLQKELQYFGFKCKIYEYQPKRINRKRSYDIQFSAPVFVNLRKQFYHGIKHVPKNLKLTWRIVAKWYEDDGNWDFNTGGVISTDGFSKSGVIRLIRELNRLGSPYTEKGRYTAKLRPTANHGKRCWKIYLPYDSPFFGKIKPYIQPCFQYKIPCPKQNGL